MHDPYKAPWRQRFLNVVERSLVELNIEFTNFSLGQTANGESRRRFFDRSIQGIEFADELTVASAIVNDCLASPILSGDIEKPQKKNGRAQLKFYKIQREVGYASGKRHRVDITTQRISESEIIKKASDNSAKLYRSKFKTSYIEAKRAKRYSNSTLEAKPKKVRSNTAGELRKNSEERLQIYDHKNRFFYVLVWGVLSNDTNDNNSPEKYLKELKKTEKFTIKEDDICIRWIPLSWPIKNELASPGASVEVEKWCWVILAQLTKK